MVITIIAVLAGLLLPVVNSVQTTAKKTSTKSTEMQIVAAVNAYQTDYSQYPVPAAAAAANPPNDFTYDMTANPNHVLFDVLRALNVSTDPNTGSLNARRTVYFESKNVKNVTSPHDGFIITGSPTGNNSVPLHVGDLVDPFGNLYYIRVDSNYTNAVKNPYADDTATATDNASATPTTTDLTLLRTGVVVYSYGVDGKIGNNGDKGTSPTWTPTPGDDVVSWQ